MFDFLFGRNKGDRPTAAAAAAMSAASAGTAKTAPGTRIGYNPELVDELKQDHRQLLRIFTDIRAAHAVGDRRGIAALLEEFRAALAAHLLKEKVRFYVYLEHALAQDSASHALVHHFRHEMEGIGKNVLAFLDRYRDIAVDPVLADGFGAELTTIGKVLVERIRNEEDNLYGLYQAVA